MMIRLDSWQKVPTNRQQSIRISFRICKYSSQQDIHLTKLMAIPDQDALSIIVMQVELKLDVTAYMLQRILPITCNNASNQHALGTLSLTLCIAADLTGMGASTVLYALVVPHSWLSKREIDHQFRVSRHVP